jgi:hypothetical protein
VIDLTFLTLGRGVPDEQVRLDLQAGVVHVASGVRSAYWSSPAHDFVPFLIGVKRRSDPEDVFGFAQSIPLALPT